VLARLGVWLACLALLLAGCGRTAVVAADRTLGAPASAARAGTRLAQLQASRTAAARHAKVVDAAVTWYLTHLTLDEQLGQMLLNGCACGYAEGPVYSPDLRTMVEDQHIGGLILFDTDFGAPHSNSFDQTRTTLREVQARASIPLLIGTDQEGGDVSRLGRYFGDFPSERDLATSGNPHLAYQWGERTARDLRATGFNLDFAPVVDVPVNGGGYWGPWRTYSEDPKVVARYAAAFMRGLQAAGVVACLKHYPGIGAVTKDPHATLPVVSRTLDQFRQTELYPYQALIPAGPDMIMATDVLVPAVDPTYPAELSRTWITDILRRQLGYDGVIMTDALWMGGVSHTWNVTEAAVLAVEAGNDIVLAGFDAASTQSILDGLKAALQSGHLALAQVRTSVQRILLLKIRDGLLPIPAALQMSPHVVAAEAEEGTGR
jgi:beta-N-acetylhexosaminidase